MNLGEDKFGHQQEEWQGGVSLVGDQRLLVHLALLTGSLLRKAACSSGPKKGSKWPSGTIVSSEQTADGQVTDISSQWIVGRGSARGGCPPRAV